MALLYPALLRGRITDITTEDLRALGVEGLLLDVDNTLATHGGQELDPAIDRWLRRMEAEGIALTIVSNALPRRVRPFAVRVGLAAIAFACKPLPLGFLRGARRLRLPRRRCAIVGDQIFTDILGANLCGMPSILVRPIQEEEHKPLMRCKRRLEKRVLDRYRRLRQAEPPAHTTKGT